MKKIILTAAAVFALTFVNAQDKGMRFGVKAGMNMSSFAGGEDSEDDASMKAGSLLGGFGEFMLTEKFALQPELMYSTQGAKYDEVTARLGYLNVPVMAKYFVGKKFSVEAGPQIGFLLSASYKDNETGDVTSKFDDGSEVKDDYNSTDFGFNLGAGYDFTKNITAALRYNLGLSGLEKDLDAGIASTKNSVFQLSVGYIF